MLESTFTCPQAQPAAPAADGKEEPAAYPVKLDRPAFQIFVRQPS